MLWQQHASCDAAAVDRMFSDPSFIPAIPASLNGLLVIDCDVHTGNGIAEWEALCSAHGIDLTQAVIVETASGGRHYYYRTVDEYSQAKLTANIDVRSVGYVIAPGATLPDGRSYRVIQGDDGRLPPPLPAALATLLSPKGSHASPAAPGALLGTATERDLQYFLVPFTAEREKLRALSEGRNDALMRIAKFAGNYVHYGFERAEIEAALYADSVANGYVAAHGSAAALTTIRHNISDGMTRPSAMPSAQAVSSEDRAAVRAQLDAAKPSQFGFRVTSTPFSEIEAEPVEWLWEGFLPRGMISLLGGSMGVGKSSVALSLAATITTAGMWPDGTRCLQPGNVLLYSSEDDAKRTIAARLTAMGADTTRIRYLGGDNNGTSCPFDPAMHIPYLDAELERIGGASLVILDPMVTAVAGDSNNNKDVRRSMEPLLTFAERNQCAVLGLTHFAKGTAGRAVMERFIGSVAMGAVARVGFIAVKDQNTGDCKFAIAKSNISADKGGFSYSLVPTSFRNSKQQEIKTTRVAWGEYDERISSEILADIESSEKIDDTAVGKARNFLVAQLATGPLYATDVEAAATQLGIAQRTLRRAREALKIIVERDKSFHAKARWSLPYDPAVIARMAPTASEPALPNIPWSKVPVQ